jgi:hypothetical protein
MVKFAYNKAKGGHKRREFDSCVRRFHLFEGMTISVKELQRENENICDELGKWKKMTRIFTRRDRSFIWRWFLLLKRLTCIIGVRNLGKFPIIEIFLITLRFYLGL